MPRDGAPRRKTRQMLMNVAKFAAAKMPMVVSQLNIRPVFDVHADVQGRDLNSAAERYRQGHRCGSAERRRRQSRYR